MINFIIEYAFLLGSLGVFILGMLINELLYQIKQRNNKKN